MNISVGGVIRLPVAVALKFTVHVVQSLKIWNDFNKAF